jgi:hypothetical protein
MLSSIHDCARNDTCWLCGEELKRKEKRVFMLCQLESAFSSAYGNPSDPRRAAFTDSVTDSPNLYEYWSAFSSVEGSKGKFCSRLGNQVDLLSTIVVVCQRSSSSCSNLYAMLTASKETIADLDPIRKKIEEEARESGNINNSTHSTSHIYQPSFLGSNSGRLSTGVRYRPYSIDHWNYVVNTARSMEGWMTKRSHEYFTIFRKWQRRYFVLDIERRTLTYYRDATKIQHRGTYQLSGELRVVTTPDGRMPREHSFQLEIHGRNQQRKSSVLNCYVDTLQNIDFWFSCLRFAIRVSTEYIITFMTYPLM